MTTLATRLVFLLAMLVPIVVGLWLYSFVLASPLSTLTAQTTHGNSSTPTPNKPAGPESLASGSAASPVPTAPPTATPTLIPQPAVEASATPITVVTPTPLSAQSTSETTAPPSATPSAMPPVTSVPTSTQT